MIILSRLAQFLKVSVPIDVTVSGIVILTRPEQFLNRLEAIAVIPCSNVMLLSAVQLLNGLEPADSNVLGIVIAVRLVQSEKARSPNLTRFAESVTSLKFLHQ